jgi:hypothetical protein
MGSRREGPSYKEGAGVALLQYDYKEKNKGKKAMYTTCDARNSALMRPRGGGWNPPNPPPHPFPRRPWDLGGAREGPAREDEDGSPVAAADANVLVHEGGLQPAAHAEDVHVREGDLYNNKFCF